MPFDRTGESYYGNSRERSRIPQENDVHLLNPLSDPRWSELIQHHPRSSVFHTSHWLEALRRTYGYEPLVFSTSPPGAPLQNGVVFCRVNSWLTGRRLVSLPFSDHCDPLVDSPADLDVILSSVAHRARQDRLRYTELRPLFHPGAPNAPFLPSGTFCFHQLDLAPSLDTLFRNCHKDSIQRKIRRAEREGLAYEEGRSESLLDAFFHLLLLTRRRHRLAPQPERWFRNLIACLGDTLQIRVAFKDRQPVAAILTLRHKDTLVYKYGASDARFHPLGGIHLLFWNSIQEAKRDNLRIFDFGRSDFDNPGLLTFKDRWGAARSTLTYSRFSTAPAEPAASGWKRRTAGRIFARLPGPLLCSVGNLLYKHLG